MIHAEHVTKRYGGFLANDDVSIEARPGELSVLLGPNGAGKSTLIKSVCGLLRFEGAITIGGHDNHTPEAKRLLGYVPEFPALYPLLTVSEHLEFIARAYRLTDWRERAEVLIKRFELDDKRKTLAQALSKGMQQKVSVCCALLHQPQAMILDEPLVGLDPHGIRELKEIMVSLRDEGCALLVSTHMIESVEESWDQTYIMMRGRVARALRRADMRAGESLEQEFFVVTEGPARGEEI